jgi:catechol 2,3-dioxygenase-like lactoylglutathione lyase family enzyme
MPNLNRLLESALYVEDLNRSVQFYTVILNLETLMSDERFCALSVAGHQVLLLFKKGCSTEPAVIPGGIIPPHDGAGNLHLAFSISAADLEHWEKRLEERGVPVESKVQWPRGGQSLYFRDPDNHLVEFVTPGCWSIY